MGKGKEEIVKVLQVVKGKDFVEDRNLISDGFLDSFELLKFVKELENQFNINIPLEHISQEEFNSIDSVYDIIQKIVDDNNK